MRSLTLSLASLIFLAILAMILAAGPPAIEDDLAKRRNLGKAFYENPTTQAESVAEFKKALDLAPNSNREKLNYGLALLRAGKLPEGVALLQEVQQKDPNLPHTWFNLGIFYKKNGEEDKAVAQFERLATLDPQEPIVQYQLGSLYRLAGRTAEAVAKFERATHLDPRLAAARFQLYNLYRQAGRQEDAAEALRIFQELKKQAEGAAIAEDVDWCNYAEVYDPPVQRTALPVTPDSGYEDRILPPTLDAKTAGLAAIDSGGTGQIDLLAWSSQGINLFLGGVRPAADTGLAGISGVLSVTPGDFDNDGLMDLCVLTEAGPLLYRNTKGSFVRQAASLPQRRFDRAVWMDYDHEYDLDLILLGEVSSLSRNEGSAGFSDRSADFPFDKRHAIDAFKERIVADSKAFDLAVFYSEGAPVLYRDQLGGRYTADHNSGLAASNRRSAEVVEADFDNNGRNDRARVSSDGRIHVALQRGGTARRWIRVQLQGVKSLKLAQDAEVEIKAGRLYRKQFYTGVPLVFDTESAATVDAVRITWPNGLIQNEVNQPTNRAYIYKEAQRLSGSCPMIWTWNGREMQFITDVLGVAPLGASDGEGTYFPVDHDEFATIPASALSPVNGQYDIRVTEELSEVSYLDQITLQAVDHPTGTEIFTNEKFKAPPYPDSRLFGVKSRIYPTAASDDQGRDVRAKLAAKDQKYPDQFERTERGIAKLHYLELDFAGAAPSGRAVLLLNGWVDWPDGSTFRAVAQESKTGLRMPYLQAQDANGQWLVVDPDMGMPAGKPKTIAVDVRWPSTSRKLRIVTNLCVYWDEIFLSEAISEPVVIQRQVPLASANLHFRGFSESRIHPQRKQPDTFFYGKASPTGFWNPTPGRYTRFGDVRSLLNEIDDRLAIIGSGDEISLRFDAALPPLAAGWTRDFLLKVDGWAKDRDPNTAFSSTVEPLPFHGMSRYPYPPNEQYPRNPLTDEYLERYNTRPALRLLRPLVGTADSSSR